MILRRRLLRRYIPSLMGLIIIIFLIILLLILITTSIPRDPINNEHNPSDSLDSPVWTRITDSIYIYSAFHDPRITSYLSRSNLTLIRLIGIKRFPPLRSIHPPQLRLKLKDETFLHDFECKLYTSSETSSTGFLTFHIFEEGILEFAGSFFNCYFQNVTLLPFASHYVALNPKKNVSNYPLKLFKVEQLRKEVQQLSLCVRPLFLPAASSIFLLEYESQILKKTEEFIHYYSLMGVTSFNFYELTVFPKLRKYLGTEMEKAVKNRKFRVQFRKWNIPTGNSHKELWDYGALAALNDCLYRNIGNTGHLIFIDLDEFIVPQQRHINNLTELVRMIEQGSSPSQILIRNTFFCNEFCKQDVPTESPKDPTKTFHISTCLRRTKRVWPPNSRSKFIVRPSHVLSVGHHMAHNFIPKINKNQDNTIVAHPNQALLYHYRNCGEISTKKNPIFNRQTVHDDKLRRRIEGFS